MDEVNPLSLEAICGGCLSTDRKIKCLSNEETLMFFREFLDCFDTPRDLVLLCWECSALIQKTVNFKRQVKYAQNFLMTCLYNSIPMPVLSKFKIKKTQNIDIIEICSSTKRKARKSKLKNIQAESQGISNNDTIVRNLDFEDDLKEDLSLQNDSHIHTECDIANVKLDLSETKNDDSSVQKLGFSSFPDIYVKTEDSLYMDADSHFIDESLDTGDVDSLEKKDNADVSDLKAVTKKTKRKRHVAYVESDDEPLAKKKNEKKVKKRVEENAASKIDHRRNPRPRREKPAGVVNNARVLRKLHALNVSADHIEMVLLSWQEVEEERQKALQSETFTRHEYRCYDCVLGFNYRVKLENHMLKHQPSAGALVCSVCRIHCKTGNALSAHRRRHRVRWRCRSCGGRWSRAAVAADHRARHHGARAPRHLCTVCGHTDTSLGRLRNHMKNHSERQKCELCEKTFRNKDSLRTHLFIHRGEKEHQCPKCDKKFLFKRALRVHLITHDAPALLYCHQCDMNFKNSMSFGQHMRYSLRHVDPAKLKHACSLCDKRFLKAARLAEHRSAVHLKTTPFHCTVPECQFASASRAVLRTHVRMLHRGGKHARNYVCHTCGKAYKNKKTLEGHLRAHTGSRPLRCTQCPATFGYDAALYNHNKLVHHHQKTQESKITDPATKQS